MAAAVVQVQTIWVLQYFSRMTLLTTDDIVEPKFPTSPMCVASQQVDNLPFLRVQQGCLVTSGTRYFYLPPIRAGKTDQDEVDMEVLKSILIRFGPYRENC